MGKSLEPAHEAEGVCPKYSSRQEGGRREQVMSGGVAGLSWWAGTALAGQVVPVRYTSAGAAEVIHQPHFLLSTFFTAALFCYGVFFPFEVLKVAKLSLVH